MIDSMEYYRLEIPMSRVFRTSLGESTKYSGFIVKIRTDDGIEGWGEAVPSRRITGETAGSTASTLDMLRPLLKGEEESSIELLWEIMERTIGGNYGAKSAVDIALWDIMGKRAGQPICRLLGGYRERMATSYTVDLGSMEEAETQIAEYLGLGIGALKVKLGKGLREDYDRVKKARQMAGDGIMIYVDFNQSYTPKRALELAESVHKFEIEFLEQPVKARDLDGLKFVRDRSNIPVMADESVHGPEDAVRIIRMGAADMLNMKLVKAGGITRGKRLIEIAEAAGLPTMIGCTVETRIGITAGTHLALALKNVRYTDLDGYQSLTQEITTDGVMLEEGQHHVSGRPGLGLSVDLGTTRQETDGQPKM